MHKIINSKRAILFILLLFFSSFAYAWNAAGHQLMAAISWDLMSSKQQNYWSDILKHHPRYKKDFIDNIPKYVKRNPQFLNEWVFRQAARWADLPRGFLQKQKEKYHHGSWHYINYPLYLDTKFNTKFVNLNTNFKGKFHNNLNIIQALKGNLNVLTKQGATKAQKALALSWILHLVGDSHQPEHSTALFDKHYFPKGDRGGNLIKIKGQGHIQNLHWFWDSRLDNTTSFKIIDLKAKLLTKKHGKRGLKNRKQTIDKWSKIANKLAKKYTYTKDILKPLKSAKKRKKSQPLINISERYQKKARIISETQIIDAAYQLVYLLEKIDY